MDILTQLNTAREILYDETARKNSEHALKLYFETALYAVDPYASYRLGKCYEKGIGVAVDTAAAIKHYTLSAETGYAEAQYALGNLIWSLHAEDEEGEEKQDAMREAMKWLVKAVEQNHAEAMYRLFFVTQATGDEDLIKNSSSLLVEAGKHGCVDALLLMGRTLLADKTEDKARTAATVLSDKQLQNVPEALVHLATLYLSGLGVEKNVEKAIEYTKKAFRLYMYRAEAGEKSAMELLADMYRKGLGVDADEAKAAEWEQKAAATDESLYHSDAFYMDLVSDLDLAIEVYEEETQKQPSLVRRDSEGGSPVVTADAIVGDGSVIDMEAIAKVIDSINNRCVDMDILKRDLRHEYRAEEVRIERESEALISDMQKKHEAYRNKLFASLRTEIEELVALLCKDYASEWNRCSVSADAFEGLTYEEIEQQLNGFVESINGCVGELNAVDFDALVPAVKLELSGKKFITYTTNRADAQKFDCYTPVRKDVLDPKPLGSIIGRLFPYCKKALACLDAMVAICDKEYNAEGFVQYVKRSATAWLAEKEARLRGQYAKIFDLLFGEKAISSSFFLDLKEQGAASDVDPTVGASTYNETITIGDVKVPVTEEREHLAYHRESPTLSKWLKNGYLLAPLVMNLRKCGNVLLNIDEENYSEQTRDFVNQMILRFLLSFPASRLNLCLIDIDNKMEFSRFKSLTKINNSILFNGIIRDDRQLENTIKDMEQVMYKIDDDVLSYNGVEDIYEYNRRFEANPQNVYLFILVNYPSGLREDTAKKVLKLVQNGNKAGIFSIIINNEDCPLPSGYKKEEYDKFIESVAQHALVFDKNENGFVLDPGIPCIFSPRRNVDVSMLPDIVDMLKESAENSKQKVVPLAQMFADSDAQAASEKGIVPGDDLLDIPIGLRGSEVQTLYLPTRRNGDVHSVVIGGTGSGKSNLLHAIIMNACYKYSPEELNLYLVDFKGGVEFKFYEAGKVKEKQIPHIKLVGLTSDLEDGVAILYNLQKELRRREDLFRQNGVEDIVHYRALGNSIPRLLVIVDEIQELFEQDDKLGQKAIDILRAFFKKGRALGINILWASQNVPKVPGLRDKVLNQIGNRISLRLNEPDDALDIKIDPKVVRNLNRPEKGLGVIGDLRYGNGSMEFRVAYAENSERRREYAQRIIDKWSSVTASTAQEPLFIVGDDGEPSPVIGSTIYTQNPSPSQIVSKAFDSYVLQLGQDYVTGKPCDIRLGLSAEKMHLLLAGYDVELLRDMMGYALLSVIMNQITNADCRQDTAKVYYANGEMLNPKNSDDLFNVLRNDFAPFIENASSGDGMLACIKEVYKTYKERSLASQSSEYAKEYAPRFIVIHSMQRYTDLFQENPMLSLKAESIAAPETATAGQSSSPTLADALRAFGAAKPSASATPSATSERSKMPDSILFADAFQELLTKGSQLGIHFIISTDNPLGIQALKNSIAEIQYKVFVKGISATVVSQMLGDYKIANSLGNPKVALLAVQDEYTKIRVYRYDQTTDAQWYAALCEKYRALWRESL